MTTYCNCLIVFFLWAGIYLPGLGSLDLKGEEPRRALPAIHMLRSGDWMVPRVGAEPYLRKPPLLNWLIAVSFKLGGINEWTARLPSALAVLALGLVMATKGIRWLRPGGALLAAIFWLTNIAMMETGRLAELEAVYCSLTGIALVCWMTAWLDDASPWQLWIPPAVFLALALLEKGPVHLLCYYGVVVGTLGRARKWSALRHPAHIAAVVLILASFAAWAVPCARLVAAEMSQNAWTFWGAQVLSHAANSDFHLLDWMQNVPRGLAAFFPWTVFLPLFCVRGLADRLRATPREADLLDGARIGSLTVFVLVSILPAASPRYVYPLICIPCLLLARIMTHQRQGLSVSPWLLPVWHYTNLALLIAIGVAALAFSFSGPALKTTEFYLVLLVAGAVTAACVYAAANDGVVTSGVASGVVMVLITAVYAVVAIPRMAAAKPRGARQIAADILQEIPANAMLWVQENSYRPFWYYLEPRVTYFTRLRQVPAAARFFLFPLPDLDPAVNVNGGARAGAPAPVLLRRVTDGHRTFQVISRQPAGQE